MSVAQLLAKLPTRDFLTWVQLYNEHCGFTGHCRVGILREVLRALPKDAQLEIRAHTRGRNDKPIHGIVRGVYRNGNLGVYLHPEASIDKARPAIEEARRIAGMIRIPVELSC